MRTESAATTGERGEALARRYLERRGLKTVAENYRTRVGEIDLIMLDKTTLVFVEVRYRKSRAFGGALHSLTPAKCAKITRTAEIYRMQHGCDGAARFDFVAVSPGREPEWIRDAFQAADCGDFQ